MATEIKMPKLGQTTDSVHLLRWLVKVGDSVIKGDPLCEVENDKTTMELESFATGTVIQLLAGPESEVTAGSIIALIGEKGEAPVASPAQSAALAGSASAEAGRAARGADPGRTRATRIVRNLAEKRGIDLERVRGSGPSGIVTKRDLDQYAGGTRPEKAPEVSRAKPAQPAPIRKEGSELNLSDRQLKLARRMVESKTQIPHYYLETTIFCERLLKARDALRTPQGEKFAFDSFFIFAAARALSRFPRLNSHYIDGGLRAARTVSVAFAVSVLDELFAPVVRDADRKTPAEIDREVSRLAARAKNDMVEHQDIMDATFTITNLGMFPIDSFQAIITPPQTGVLAIGRVRRTMDIDETNAFRVRPLCTVWGSFDHRVINGAQGAEFLQEFKRVVEEEIENR